MKSAVKVVNTPCKTPNLYTARKELSIHNSDAQDFEDLFGFRPNQNKFGVGNHAKERNRVKNESTFASHNLLRIQLELSYRES